MSDVYLRTATKLITAPTAEPFTVDEAKAHLRIDIDDDDANIQRWITAARAKVERDTGRALLTQTWDLFLDGFWGASQSICLPYAPLQSVTSVNITDINGAETAWASTNYIVDTASEPGRLALVDAAVWPSSLRTFQPVRIRFVAGWLTPDVIPADLLQAMALLIGEFSENRQTTAAFQAGEHGGDVYETLIGSYVLFAAA